MKNLKLALMGLTLIGSSLAFAQGGDRAGNGGDAVVCRDSKGSISSIELLDFYEGRTQRGLSFRRMGASTLEESLNRTKDLLNRFDKELVIRIAPAIGTLLRASSVGSGRVGTVLFTDEILEDIKDSDHILLPRGCAIEQLAVKVNKQFSRDPEFIIQKDLWNHLSDKDKAGLILHEAIYKHTSSLGQINSKTARYFNQVISSDSFEAFTYIDYLVLAGDAGLSVTNSLLRDEVILDPGTVQEAAENGFYEVSTLENSYNPVVMDVNGVIDYNRTVAANPRSYNVTILTDESKLDELDFSINGKQICEIKKFKFSSVDRGYNAYRCRFTTLVGLAEYELTLSSKSKTYVRAVFVGEERSTPSIHLFPSSTIDKKAPMTLKGRFLVI